MLVVAILTIRSIESFRDFETRAALIMARHGGGIAHAYELAGEPLRELHVVRFPDEAAFHAYAADPELVAMRPLRDQAIAATELWPAREVSY